jgi:hypothetical protein
VCAGDRGRQPLAIGGACVPVLRSAAIFANLPLDGEENPSRDVICDPKMPVQDAGEPNGIYPSPAGHYVGGDACPCECRPEILRGRA